MPFSMLPSSSGEDRKMPGVQSLGDSRARIFCATSKPLMSGRALSSSTRSGLSLAKAARAAPPLSAGMAAAPKCLTDWISASRLGRWYSTTRIFMASDGGDRYSLTAVLIEKYQRRHGDHNGRAAPENTPTQGQPGLVIGLALLKIEVALQFAQGQYGGEQKE